jgi:hypothetical protein
MIDTLRPVRMLWDKETQPGEVMQHCSMCGNSDGVFRVTPRLGIILWSGCRGTAIPWAFLSRIGGLNGCTDPWDLV